MGAGSQRSSEQKHPGNPSMAYWGLRGVGPVEQAGEGRGEEREGPEGPSLALGSVSSPQVLRVLARATHTMIRGAESSSSPPSGHLAVLMPRLFGAPCKEDPSVALWLLLIRHQYRPFGPHLRVSRRALRNSASFHGMRRAWASAVSKCPRCLQGAGRAEHRVWTEGL